MTFDLLSKKLIAEFAPGIGQEMEWGANDRIVIIAGCGSGCMNATIFDVFGKRHLSADESMRVGGSFCEQRSIQLDPTRRALVFMPQIHFEPGPIVLLRVEDNRTLRIGPTNGFCTVCKTNRDDLVVGYTTDSENYLPITNITIRVPKDW